MKKLTKMNRVVFLILILLVCVVWTQFGCFPSLPTSYTSCALVDTFSFDFREYNFYESDTLEYGIEYMLVVSGTFATWPGLPNHDARYMFDPQTNNEIGSLYDTNRTFAWDNGDGVFPEPSADNYADYNRKPLPDEYSPDHIYHFYFISDGTTEMFMFYDGASYRDNSGKLYFVLCQHI